MRSTSATYDEAIADYKWFKYTGQRGKEVSERTHKRMIRDGDIIGIKSLRSGSRFTLIFPDMPHINFPLDSKAGNMILDRSTQLRKLPDIAQREGRAKVRGVKTVERQLNRANFDTARYTPRTVPNEYKNGIEFGNYQWRIVSEPSITITHTKGKEILKKNEMIGLRYIRDAKGGVAINEKGMYLKLSPENYDKLVADTLVMPIQDWPNGSISDEDVKEYRRDSKKAKHRTQMEMREGARLEQRAEKLAREIEARNLREANKESARAEQERFDDMKEKIKRGEMEAPAAKPMTFDTEENAIPTVRLRNQIKSILAEEELLEEEEEIDPLLEAEEIEEEEEDDMFSDLGDILTSRPFASDNMAIDSVLGAMFGGDDSADVDPDFDLSSVDEEPDDEEEDAPVSKVKQKGKGKKAAPVEESDDENSDDENSDDESEDEDADESEEEEEEEAEESDDEESDDEDSEEEEDTDDEDSEEEDDSEEEEEDDSEEEEEEDTDDEESEEEDGAEIDESDDGEVDEDVLNAEQEAAENAKKQATENKGTPEKLANPESGDVIVFKADEKLKREWVILRESSHKSSDSIIVYTLYDLTNSPDEVRQVRINKARKQSLFDIAEHVKDMKPTLFARVYDMTEEFEVNKEPIVS